MTTEIALGVFFGMLAYNLFDGLLAVVWNYFWSDGGAMDKINRGNRP